MTSSGIGAAVLFNGIPVLCTIDAVRPAHANPDGHTGTSEMHVVAALDDAPDMHAVLTLFEAITKRLV